MRQTRMFAAAVAAMLILCVSAAYAVEPAYRGPMGNPEEPALRPVKWAWHGTKALFYHTFIPFKYMREKGLCGSSREAVRGLRRGTVIAGQSVYRGAIGSQVPERKAYRKIGTANELLEQQEFMHLCDAKDKGEGEADTPAPPALTVAPAVAASGEPETRPAAPRAETARSRLNAAQRDYIGDRVHTYESKSGRGNLLRLAR